MPELEHSGTDTPRDVLELFDLLDDILAGAEQNNDEWAPMALTAIETLSSQHRALYGLVVTTALRKSLQEVAFTLQCSESEVRAALIDYCMSMRPRS